MPPAGDRNGDYFFQQFVPGTVCSASFLATGGDCRLLGMTEMLVGCDWVGAAGFTYCGSILRHQRRVECGQWTRIGRAIAREFSLIGLFGVDGVVSKGQIWPIEVNPRYTASMELLELALGISLIGVHVNACYGRQFPWTPAPRMDHRVVGKSILFAPHDLQLNTQFGDLATCNRSHVKLADVPEPGGIVRRGRPILTVIVTADSRDQVVNGLRVSSAELLTQTTRVQ
jgi:predicted ATP-grasp superfamily ATP-dependent carboligase